MMDRGFENVQAWPRTGNPERCEIEFRKWHEAVRRLEPGEERDFAEALPELAGGRAMLECLFGASPFLSGRLIRDPGFVRKLWTEGPDSCAETIFAELERFPADAGEEEARRLLSIARLRLALLIALADIAGLWDLEQVTGAMTRLAEAACSVGFRTLLAQLGARGFLESADPEDPEADSGLIALGLGKLGGRELNYSSDIDLILLYDPDRVPTRDAYKTEARFLNLARSFIALLSARSVEGQTFRVDLRLRPDPVATPLVLSTKSAERYYEKRGQTWERAALIKARPVAADIEAGERFLERIAPFIWRPNLDFATVRDLRDIKKRIDEQHGSGAIGVRGHNLKLGRGGIREIEFFAQTHQLVWGGRDPRFRTIPTCESLRTLTAAGHVPPEATEDLIEAYRFLRNCEHRVQMVADKQTHSLPKDPAEYETLSRFLGYPDGQAYSRELIGYLQRVELRYESFFEFPFPAETETPEGSESQAELVERLGRMGFGEPAAAAAIVAKWRGGRCPAAQEPLSRELLQALASPLLIAMCGTTDPDLALARFDSLFDNLPDSIQTFSLFQANLHTMETVAEIMVSAPIVYEFLQARPFLLETLVAPEEDAATWERAALAGDLAADLEPAAGYEDALDRLGEWVDRLRFRVCVQLLFQSLDPLQVPALLSDIADCALAALHGQASAEFAARFGRISGGESALLAVGALGIRGITTASPVDLAFICSAPAGARADGLEALDAREYFDRFLAFMLEGIGPRNGRRGIYETSLRFPPPSEADPAQADPSSLGRFLAAADARTRMAFAQVRVIAGSGGFASDAGGPLPGALAEATGGDQLGAELASKTRGPEEPAREAGSIAYCRDGLAKLDALLRYLLLSAGPSRPAVPTDGTSADAFRALSESGSLAGEDAARLVDAWECWTRVQALQRLIGDEAGSDDVPAKLEPLFQSAVGVDSLEAVRPRLEEIASAVEEICGRLAP